MKKLLFMAIAAFFTLIFTACSGDLHEPLERENVQTGVYTPSITSEEEISIFFKTGTQDDYYFWAWSDTVSQFTVASWPGDLFTLKGTDSADGKYIYKYVISGTETPSKFIISHGSDEKIYNEKDFVNHGLYTEGEDEPITVTKISSEETTVIPPSTEITAEPVELDISNAVVKGDFDGTGIALTQDEENSEVYTITVNYRKSMSAWGGGNGIANFKIFADGDADGYGYTQFDTENSSIPEEITISANGTNVKLSGLKDLSIYTLSFSLSDDKYKILLTVEETGTFEAPAAPTSYNEISIDETSGNTPDTTYSLDETTGSLYSITDIPSWYKDGSAIIWAIVTDNSTSYYKRVKYDTTEGIVYFTTEKSVTSVQLKRCNPEGLAVWNSTKVLTVSENSAVYDAE